MPLKSKIIINSATVLAIWDADEPLEDLFSQAAPDPDEKAVLDALPNEKRKKEKLASMLLLRKLLPGGDIKIIYDEFGKPHLKDHSMHFSLSHSRNMVAVIVSKNPHAGIDIELIQPRILNIAHKFISKAELDAIEPANAIEQMHVIWGAKECLYKIYGKKELDFCENLHTEPFVYTEKGFLQATINKNGFSREYTACYEKTGDFMLTYIAE